MKESVAALTILFVFAGLFLAARVVLFSLPAPEAMLEYKQSNASPGERGERIRSCFGADGSYFRLVNDVKSSMRNPESFEHVSTEYTDRGTGSLIVTMRYKCKSVEGRVTSRIVSADVPIDGWY